MTVADMFGHNEYSLRWCCETCWLTNDNLERGKKTELTN